MQLDVHGNKTHIKSVPYFLLSLLTKSLPETMGYKRSTTTGKNPKYHTLHLVRHTYQSHGSEGQGRCG